MESLYFRCAEKLPAKMSSITRSVLSKLVSSVGEFNTGDTVVHSGSKFNALRLLVDGAFKSVMLGEDGKQQVIHFYWPTELMALDAFSSLRHTTDLVALRPSLVYEFSLKSIEQAAENSPDFFESLLTFVSDRLVEAESDQFMLGSLQATQRLAFFLIMTKQALKETGFDDGAIELPMTRRDIGSYLGLTTESVSRLISWMEKESMIDVHRRFIRLLDLQRIQSLLGETPSGSPLSSPHPMRT